MRVKFNGYIEERTSGCGICGTKRKSERSLTTHKMFILPSGKTITFYIGKDEEVSDSDGEFLLSYNGEREVFTKL